MWRRLAIYTIPAGLLGHVPTAHAQELSPAGWAIYGAPLVIFALLVPLILARKGFKAFLSFAAVAWIYAWLAAASLDATNVASPMNFIYSGVSIETVVAQIAAAIGFGLPVWIGAFTIWLLARSHANVLAQSIGGILAGGLFCLVARIVSFATMLVLLAVIGRLS